METALNRARDELPTRQALTLVRPDHGVLLMTVRNGGTRSDGPVSRAAATLHRVAAELLAEPTDWTPLVGVGDARSRLTDAELTYRHARQAAEVSAVVRSFGPVTRWDDIGVYQTLVDLPVAAISSSRLHPGLALLLDSREAETWLRTLEVYLDAACDARSAARTLNIQRGSLYHRLNRIEEIAGVDLRTGSDRLALHLGLKVARLAGLLDSPAATR